MSEVVNTPVPPGKRRSHGLHTVAIVGPPNSGKSTLFNQLTGLRQKVANYPGVTVEQRTGRMRLAHKHEIDLIDLPGVYSLEPRSEDERVTRDVLRGRMEDIPKPEAVILILDATNLARHLVLAAPVLNLGLPTLVVLNMADALANRGGEVDTNALAQKLGVPVALISAAKGEGIEPVLEFLTGQFAVPAPVELPVLNDIPKCRQWATRIGNEASYRPPAPPIWTRRLDAVFLHPLAGPLVFLAVVVAVFQTIFTGAEPLMNAVERMVAASGAWVAATLPSSVIRDVLVEGVWGGVGSVLVFLPQILLLFLFIGVLEDSGYLA
ncbi:MAG: ferrous iron transporter B, partial [bacterium]|nr:ferrous iron transporter B [bacterium]